MKVSIVSCGEGHNIGTMMGFMERVHELCMELSVPHPVITAKLDDEPLKFSMTDERKEWVRQVMVDETNLSFSEWRVEYQRHEAIRTASCALFDYKVQQSDKVKRAAFDQLDTFIGGMDEDGTYTFYMYATDLDAYNKGNRNKFVEMPTYHDWVKIKYAIKDDVQMQPPAEVDDDWVGEYSISNQHPEHTYPQYQDALSMREGFIGIHPDYNNWVHQRLDSEKAQ